MATLTITDFSCLKEATFNLAPVNIIIGPQGSGKSVTTKLLYFCTDILASFLGPAEKGETFEQYKLLVAKSFGVWFPPAAWGKQRFIINYSAGPFTMRIMRRRTKTGMSDQVSITFSDWFSEIYKWSSALYESARGGDLLELENAGEVSENIDRIFRVRDAAHRRLQRDLNSEYIAQQTFIPAGRAFFTSMGRVVAGFEPGTTFDPVTLKFARLFANLRDRVGVRSRMLMRLGDDFKDRRADFMTRLFGGQIKSDGDSEYVETTDGRKIPFSALSSGQQELLPMWSLVDYFNERDAMRTLNLGTSRSARPPRELVYIEEPEAHLFPSAQSFLMEFLIGSSFSTRRGRNLILTTHSPYIMGKINLFLKAGQLSRRKKKNEEINSVIPRECWLTDRQLAAYSIEGGELHNLIDEDDLIDGRYLDSISEEISRDFSRLLRIEAEI